MLEPELGQLEKNYDGKLKQMKMPRNLKLVVSIRKQTLVDDPVEIEVLKKGKKRMGRFASHSHNTNTHCTVHTVQCK